MVRGCEGGGFSVEFATEAGWLSLRLPATEVELGVDWGLDLSLLLKVLRSASWPRTGGVGDVVMEVTGSGLRVAIPVWRQGPTGWFESGVSEFSFPLGQGIWCDPGMLPGIPESFGGDGLVLEPQALSAVVSGVGSCVDSRSDRGVLQCVELVCRPDEVVGMATDGCVVGLSSEPAALALGEEFSVPLPPASARAFLSIWEKLQLQGDVLLRVNATATGGLLELSPADVGSDSLRVVLRLPQGHVPMDLLERLPVETVVEMGRVDVRERLLRPLELAELNPDAKAAWLVWEGGRLRVCSHGPLLDLQEEVPLASPSTEETAEVALDVQRLRRALEQLKASGGVGPITLSLDSAQRPGRLMLRQTNPGTGQVRRVLVLALAGTSYETFRARAAELKERDLAAERKQRRRQQYAAPVSG